MRTQARRPERIAQISVWLRQGEITPSEALKLAVDLRRRREKSKPEPAAAETPKERDAKVQSVLRELEGLTGLRSVKRHVREVQAFTAIQLKRAEVGLAHQRTGLHMIFTGNPGTGKTTVARLLGRLFKEMGILPQGHMVEVERADLVGEYIGHTAQKTREVVRRAVGGVLFIDEAYSLARGGEKDFGKESIDCLVRAMEDHRNEMMLILAGYPMEMEWFVAQNPGLRSRFPLHIQFPDYAAEELIAIGEQMWREHQYELNQDCRQYLRQLLSGAAWSLAGETGNARAMRNLVERTLRCQAVRLVDRPSVTRDDLATITRSDVEHALRALQAE